MRHFIISILLVLNSCLLFAQTVDVCGVVYDKENLSPIKYCWVCSSQQKIVFTDSVGRYTVPVPIKGKTELVFKLIGYYDSVTEILPGAKDGDNYDVWMERDSLAFGQESQNDKVVAAAIDATPLLTPYDDNHYYFLHSAAIPDECIEIIIYTQPRTARTKKERMIFGEEPYYCPYVVRFQDSSSVITNKLFKGRFLRHFKKIPVEQLSIEGFHLLYTDVEKNDPVAQRALRTVNEYGLRFYGKQETPVFYFVREGK